MVNVHKALQAGKTQIDAAIRAAEKGTSGEVVVVSTRRAGNYGQAESIFCYTLGLIVFLTMWIYQQNYKPVPGILIGMGFSSIALIAGYTLGLAFLKLFPWLSVFLTPKRVVAYEVERSAALAFRQFEVARTKGGTGVLVYIAEAERTVTIMGDSAISSLVTTTEWESSRDAILDGIRNGQPVEGLIEGTKRVGDLLRKHFPSDADTDDELPSELHLT